MLFIWDLHFKMDKKEEIFKKLLEKIELIKPSNIVFLWDYVYHFAYNPKIIWDFFDFCLKLSKNKKIFILAWNHDYIKWHFIFKEAEKALNLANTNLKIISLPKIEIINNTKFLFFPYFTDLVDEETILKVDKTLKSAQIKEKNILNKIFIKAYQNYKQEDNNLKISWSINIKFVEMYLLHKPQVLVHHFYTENKIFPWQFSKFSFKNIALDENILDLDMKIISWHLHQPFKYKNYICVWSFWNTSQLEENDTKVIFYYPDNFYQIIINPYITIDSNDYNNINKEIILDKFEKNIINIENNLWKNIIRDNFSIKNINLTIKTNSFKTTEEKIDKKLIKEISNINYRQKINKLWNILDQLKIDNEQLAISFSSWKQLAQEYIKKKYPDNFEEYNYELNKLWLL